MTTETRLRVLRLWLQHLRVVVGEIDLGAGEGLVEIVPHQLVLAPLPDGLRAPEIEPPVKLVARPPHFDGSALREARAVRRRQADALVDMLRFTRARELRLEFGRQAQRARSWNGRLCDWRTWDIRTNVDEITDDRD